MKHLFLILVVISLSGFGQTAEDYYNKGFSKFSLKDYTGAIADFNTAIQLKPDYALAYFKRETAMK
jgi:tetratricopeptide (TPR) repeat protein